MSWNLEFGIWNLEFVSCDNGYGYCIGNRKIAV